MKRFFVHLTNLTNCLDIAYFSLIYDLKLRLCYQNFNFTVEVIAAIFMAELKHSRPKSETRQQAFLGLILRYQVEVMENKRHGSINQSLDRDWSLLLTMLLKPTGSPNASRELRKAVYHCQILADIH